MSVSAREALLMEAVKCVTKDRNAQYGPPEDSFKIIAKLWSLILGVEVTAHQVALCLVQLKVARLVKNPTHHDSKVDGAGYFACMADIDPVPTPAHTEPPKCEASVAATPALPPEYTSNENGGKHLFKQNETELPFGGISVYDVLRKVQDFDQWKLTFPPPYESQSGEVLTFTVDKKKGLTHARRSGSPRKPDAMIPEIGRYMYEDFCDGLFIEVTSTNGDDKLMYHKNPTSHFRRLIK